MNKAKKVFKEIHDIYESWYGGSLRLDMISEDLIEEAIVKAINCIDYSKIDVGQLQYNWKERCLLAENFINETPCDPDIYQAQQEAWSEWISYKQSMEKNK